MASVFKRKDSPYWWIRQKEGKKWIGKSTKYRVGVPLEDRRARAEAAQLTSDELGIVAISDTERWDHWVSSYFGTHCTNAATRTGYRQSWDWVRLFLSERKIDVPAQLTYADAFAFIDWRMKEGRSAKSTALRDLKVLRLVMTHAVRAGMAAGNPCYRMGIERPAAKQKPELSDEDVRLIYKHLSSRDPWMNLAFSICLHTGCRISEANLERLSLDFKRRTLTFNNPKGGAKKAFTTILSPALAKIIRRAIEDHGREVLIPPPVASQLFGKFFRQIGLREVTIHSTRVTFISRLARSDVPERVARLAVNHSSEAVHRIYQRLRVDDLRQIEKAVHFPAPPRLGRGTRKETPDGARGPQKEESPVS